VDEGATAGDGSSQHFRNLTAPRRMKNTRHTGQDAVLREIGVEPVGRVLDLGERCGVAVYRARGRPDIGEVQGSMNAVLACRVKSPPSRASASPPRTIASRPSGHLMAVVSGNGDDGRAFIQSREGALHTQQS
jgi:hypothetical protein